MLYLAVIFPFIAHFLPTENKNIKLAISIAPAIFIILFRWGLGTDYFSYEGIYHAHRADTLLLTIRSRANTLEKGFNIIMYVFRKQDLSFQSFIATVGIIIYFFIMKWIYDSEKDYTLSIMLFNGMFFVVWVLSGVRQGLVISLGTFFFFNKKFSMNLWISIILVLLLGQIHMSAYFYLLILLLKQFDYSKKTLTYILFLSLISTLVPLQLILEHFQEIKLVTKLFYYLTGQIGFWNFSGLIRLIFALFILLNFDFFSKDKYMKKLAEINVLGFSLYFVLKPFENAAGRLNVYTFILIIPLLIYFAKEFSENKKIQNTLIILLLIFSLTYLQKDLISHQREINKDPVEIFYRMQTFYNKQEE